MDKQIYNINDASWEPVRKDVTKGIEGIGLLRGNGAGPTLTLTRVEPGGEFAPHKDGYHHILYFFKGNGEGLMEETTYHISPGTVVQIPSGTLHSYRNTGNEEMMLLTVNIPT